MNTQILSDIIKQGIDRGYAPNDALEIYNKAQDKQYNRNISKGGNLFSNLELDYQAFQITSRYFQIYNYKKK